MRFPKNALALLAIGLLLIAPLRAQESGPLHLTLEEAARLALAQNPQIRVLMARLGMAEQDVEIVSAPTRLRASIEGDLSYVLPPDGSPLGASIAGVNTDFRTQAVDPFTRTGANLKLRKLLYDGGRLAAAIEARRSDQEQVRQTARAAWHTLYFQLQEAYLLVLRLKARLEVARLGLNLARRSLETAEKKWRAGLAPKGDVVAARLPVADAGLVISKLENELQSALEGLNRLVGLPQATKLELGEPLEPATPLPALEQALAQAYAEHPQLQALEAKAEGARKRLLAAKKDNNLNLVLAGDALPVAFSGQDLSLGYELGLRMEWRFADGGRSLHLATQADYQIQEAEAELEAEKQLIEQEVRKAHRDAQFALENQDVSRIRVRASEDVLRIAEARYRAGLGPLSEVRVARRSLLEAQTSLAESKYDLLQARAGLARALGVRPTEERPFGGS